MAENEVIKSSDKRRMRDEANAKSKRKGKLIIAVIILCAILCVVLTVLEGNGIYRKKKAVEINGTEYSVAEANWMYSNSFFELYESISNTYGSYAQYILNPQQSLKEQQYSEDQTWADYIKEYSEQKLINLTVLYDEAKNAGWVLDQAYYDQIDSDLESIKNTATSNGTDLNSYLILSYGKGVNEKVYKEMYEKYYYAYSYANSVRDGIEITSSEIDAKYNEDKKAYDQVTYNYIFVDGTAAESEDATEVLEKAKTTAEAVVAAENMSEYVENELGTTVTTVRYSTYANVSSTFADWLFDDARVAGDKEKFDGTNGYYVVEFVEKGDLHYNMVDVRHILVAPEDTSNEASWETAEETVNSYYDAIKGMGLTENNFAAAASVYSQDSGSASIGGLVSNIYKGETVKPFEDWCFDESRKAGDTEIIKSDYGYHIMYFVSQGEEYYTSVIDGDIRDERFNEIVEGYSEGYELTELPGIKYVGKHL